MKGNLKDFLFNLSISMFIGLFVGMVQVTAVNINSETITILIISSIIGGAIGTISMSVFIYIFAIKQKDVKLAFISVFIIIGAISYMPSFYYYLAYNNTISLIQLISILISAELLGMSFSYYSYRKCLDLNSKLKNKKQQLKRKS
ncbi:hypothetical protein [Clostridium kluyveri]|uniref:Uncharacterized protein n=2 Tax=Clostridium kluyveri TaxID=1534 RepID=A5N5K1_CLOK5|nr:hypothetical protein [Clostridium kluyveri]EDK32582.1 Conserved hypothetical protein [Clostridium kluyveri DSM 555]BAH05516.1 hypothetical protein CKR_0465 [Clostridium kluyveri NBRC 12016]